MSSDKEATSVLAWSFPMYLRVLCGVIVGIVIGCVCRLEIWPGDRREALIGVAATAGQLASLIVNLLKALATPLIFFGIVDAFIKTNISGRQGLKMIAICLFNVVVAFAIGLTIINQWHPGEAWREEFSALTVEGSKLEATEALNVVSLLKKNIPDSFLAPFVKNEITGVVILAVLAGIALRGVRKTATAETSAEVTLLEHAMSGGFAWMMKILEYVIYLVPFAVCGILAAEIAKRGLREVFESLAVFLAVVLAGLGIHAFVYYPLVNWLLGGKSPLLFFREGAEAILTGLSLNSSLATVPATLQALDRMGVSSSSARLSACVGTNFNNDGITLYEAMTALFVAQAAGYNLSLGEQITVMLASLLASAGIAGIPNSGMIILPAVLAAAGLPPDVIAKAYGMALGVDWIAARCRSAVNVMGDMTVAIMLDAGEKSVVP